MVSDTQPQVVRDNFFEYTKTTLSVYFAGDPVLRGISLYPCPALRVKTTSAKKEEKTDFVIIILA